MESSWLQTLRRALACETHRFDLVTLRRRDDCVRLLRESIDGEWTIFGSRPVMGRIGDTTFSLRKRIFYSNSFQTNLRGEFVEESRQTRLRCLSAPYPIFMWFVLVWLGAIALFGGVFAAAAIRSLVTGVPLAGSDPLLGAAIPFLMLAGGIALVRFGRFLARNEERYLVEFLSKTLDAREAP